MVLTPPRPRVWPYLLATSLTIGVMSYGAWRITHPPRQEVPPAREERIVYARDTLPLSSVKLTLREEEDGKRTVILLKNQQDDWEAWGVYTTPRGVRIGTPEQYYATLSDEEKLWLLVRLGHDLPRLARYAYADYAENWPRVKQDLRETLDYLIKQLER